MDYRCPRCNSDRTQSLAIVYERGLSSINTFSAGMGVGLGGRGRGLGLGGAKTLGTSQSVASRRAAPPAKRPYLKPLAWLGTLSALAVFLLPPDSEVRPYLLDIWVIGAVLWIGYAVTYNLTTWRVRKAQWDRTFICNRCNLMFPLVE